MKKIALFIVLIFVAIACDVVDKPYLQNESKIGDFKKKVVLIDFTAVHCVYCPNANKKASDLAKQYGEDNVILIGAHASKLAIPDEGQPDLRSQTSTELFDKFATPTTGLPVGMVNQKESKGVRIFNFGSWDNLIIEESYKEPDLNMDMKLTYNETDSTVGITVDCNYLNDGSKDDNICVYVTEDSIVAAQKNNSEVIEDYVHNHVLRGAITPTFGDPVKAGNIKAGESIQKKYNYTIPKGFRHNKLRFIAIVQNKNTNLIKQSTAKYLYEKSE
ncbi:hypothetical protein EP342_00735 [bacterium]|nr:MAG: hypothetical protein EP342_00735 [bacterium]